MKKFLVLLMAALIVCMGVVALAEGETGTETGTETQIPADAVTSGPHWSTKDPIEKVEATCTKDGVYTYQCEHCTSIFTVIQYSKDLPGYTGKHEVVDGGTVTKIITTCTELGGELISECKICGEKNVMNYDEKLADHTFDASNQVTVKEATCQNPLTLKNTCTVCGKEITWEDGPKLPHDYQGVNAVAATCTKEGVSATVYKCTMCGEMDPQNHEGKVLEKLDHSAKVADYFVYLTEDNAEQYVNPKNDIEVDGYGDPGWGAEIGYEYAKDITKWNLPLDEYTVDANGYYLDASGNKICIAADGYTAGTTVNAATDTYCEETVTYVLATCDKTGSVTVTCKDCGYTHTETIPAMGHKYEITDSEQDHQQVDCTKGMDVIYTCAACGEVYKSSVPAQKAHDFTAYGWNVTYIQKDKEYDSKYDEDNDKYLIADEICEGLDYVVRVYCNNPMCNVYKDTKVIGDPSKHAIKDSEHPEYHVFQAATCEEAGFEYYYCPKCGTAAYNVLPKLAHVFDKAVIDPKPTCTEEGVRSLYCQLCKKVYETERVPALGHDYVVDAKATKFFTCTNDGLVVEVCSFCGDKKETVVKAHHVYATKEDGSVDTDSDMVVSYTAPTCVKAGKISYYCTVCHAPIKDEAIAALGHERSRADYVHDASVTTDVLYEGVWYTTHTKANCTNPEIYSYTCTICNTLVEVKVGSKIEGAHEDFKEWGSDEAPEHGFVITKMPTCEETGTAVYNCSICKKVVTVELEKLPHNYSTYWDDDAKKYVTTCMPMFLSDLPSIKDEIDAIAPTLYDRLTTLALEKEVTYDYWIWDEENEEDVQIFVTDHFVPGIGCGDTIELAVKPTKYDITISADQKTVTATLQPDCIPLNADGPYLFVVWSWTLADGTNMSLTHTYDYNNRVSDITEPQFRIGSANTPDGATLDYILVIITNDEDASTMEKANVGDYGYAMFTK